MKSHAGTVAGSGSATQDRGRYHFKAGSVPVPGTDLIRGDLLEVDTILAPPEVWAAMDESRDSAWAARTTTLGLVLALRVVT